MDDPLKLLNYQAFKQLSPVERTGLLFQAHVAEMIEERNRRKELQDSLRALRRQAIDSHVWRTPEHAISKGICEDCGKEFEAMNLPKILHHNTEKDIVAPQYVCTECFRIRLEQLQKNFDIPDVFFWWQKEKAAVSAFDEYLDNHKFLGKTPLIALLSCVNDTMMLTDSGIAVIEDNSIKRIQYHEINYIAYDDKYIIFNSDKDFDTYMIHGKDEIPHNIKIRFSQEDLSNKNKERICQLILTLRDYFASTIDKDLACCGCGNKLNLAIDDNSNTHAGEFVDLYNGFLRKKHVFLCKECQDHFSNIPENRNKLISDEKIISACKAKIKIEDIKHIPINEKNSDIVWGTISKKMAMREGFSCNVCRKNDQNLKSFIYDDIGYVICDKCFYKFELENAKLSSNDIDINARVVLLSKIYDIGGVYFKGGDEKNIEKIKKAIKNYHWAMSPREEIFFCYDNTFFGSVDEGCVLTNKGIHVQTDGDNEFIDYHDLQELRSDDNNVYMNQVTMQARFMRNGEQKDFCQLIKEIQDAVLGQTHVASIEKEDTIIKGEGKDNVDEEMENADINNTVESVISLTAVQQTTENSLAKSVENGEKNQAQKCPACGEQNPPDNKFCDECGAPMEPPKEQKKCPACGAVVEDDEKFCTECGAALETRKVCPNCGAEVKEGKKFCGKCGTKLI